MRKVFFTAIAVMAILATSCVTKQKYLELEGKYKECMEDKRFSETELADCQNKNKDLAGQLTSD